MGNDRQGDRRPGLHLFIFAVTVYVWLQMQRQRMLLRRSRRVETHCVRCGYSRLGLTGPTCPECEHEWTREAGSLANAAFFGIVTFIGIWSLGWWRLAYHAIRPSHLLFVSSTSFRPDWRSWHDPNAPAI